MLTTNFKKFKYFIGNLTVSSSIIYCSTQHAKNFVTQQSDHEEYTWSKFSNSYGVKLDISDIERYNQRIYQLLLLNVYTALDQYIYGYKRDYRTFTEKEWSSEKGASFIDDLRKNLNLKEINHKENFDSFLYTIDYYRYIRNSIVHNSPKDLDKVLEYRNENIARMNHLKEHYSMKSVPSRLEEINFHDVKYFSRILLDFLPEIEALLYPGDDKIIHFLSEKQLKKYKKLEGERAKNHLINCLVNELGLSYEHSKKIVNTHSLA